VPLAASVASRRTRQTGGAFARPRRTVIGTGWSDY
jgi:hypothetical protein